MKGLRLTCAVVVRQLQRKRHIGNDIVCVVFLEADNTPFSPACIKSHFLHTFILVRTSPKIKRKPTRYEVSVVTRDEVGAYKPYLWEQSVFDKGPMFREWLLTKIVNGERASYSAPKFARMQERTRSQVSQHHKNFRGALQDTRRQAETISEEMTCLTKTIPDFFFRISQKMFFFMLDIFSS